MTSDDPFDLKKLRVDPADGEIVRLVKVPTKIRKRRQRFIKVPWIWFEKLASESGQTYRVALYLMYRHWKCGGKPVKLPNKSLVVEGVSRQSKWRALARLQALDLIRIEHRPSRSPIVHLSHL
jgi:hypothetical protein